MLGSLVKRGKKSWRIKVEGKRGADGKRKTFYETFRGTKTDAEARRIELLPLAKKGKIKKPSKFTLKEWILHWLKNNNSHVSPKTLERYWQLLILHVIPYIGDMILEELDVTAVQSLYTTLREVGYKPRKPNGEPGPLGETTISHVHSALRKCLGDAVNADKIEKNVCDKVNAPKQTKAIESSENFTALDMNQLRDLLNYLKGDPLFEMIAFAAATGARLAEIDPLTFKDFDHVKRRLKINKSVTQLVKQKPRIKDTKNKTSRRTIEIDPDTTKMIVSLKLRYKSECLKLGKTYPDDGLIFPHSLTSPYELQSPSSISKRFTKMAKRAGFPGFTFHSLRHTHASLLLSEDVPVNAVSARLGHSNAVVTMNTYSHLLKRAEDQASSVAASFMSGALGN